MAVLVWDASGERFYETGIDHGVLYTLDQNGAYKVPTAWNGLISVTESPSGAEATALWADNIKYMNMISAEEFGVTIEAYTYPDEFLACDGAAMDLNADGVILGQQARAVFGLSYRSLVGNDLEGQSHGYKLHLVYGCLAAPSEKAYQTVNDSPEAVTFSWEVKCTPVTATGYKPVCQIIIDSRTADPTCLEALEDLLYGTLATTGQLPSPDTVISTMTPVSV